jgi:hypothetical protein
VAGENNLIVPKKNREHAMLRASTGRCLRMCARGLCHGGVSGVEGIVNGGFVGGRLLIQSSRVTAFSKLRDGVIGDREPVVFGQTCFQRP